MLRSSSKKQNSARIRRSSFSSENHDEIFKLPDMLEKMKSNKDEMSEALESSRDGTGGHISRMQSMRSLKNADELASAVNIMTTIQKQQDAQEEINNQLKSHNQSFAMMSEVVSKVIEIGTG